MRSQYMTKFLLEQRNRLVSIASGYFLLFIFLKKMICRSWGLRSSAILSPHPTPYEHASVDFFPHHEQGSSIVEFAVVVPILFLLVSGTLDFGTIIARQNELNNVVNVGLLYATADSNTSNIQGKMQAATTLTGMTSSVTSFCECTNGQRPGCSASCADSATPGVYLTLTAQMNVSLSGLMGLANPYPISAKAILRIS